MRNVSYWNPSKVASSSQLWVLMTIQNRIQYCLIFAVYQMTNEFQFFPNVVNNWFNHGFVSHQTVYPLGGVRGVNFKQSWADFCAELLV